jgi:hypothetical protein
MLQDLKYLLHQRLTKKKLYNLLNEKMKNVRYFFLLFPRSYKKYLSFVWLVQVEN